MPSEHDAWNRRKTAARKYQPKRLRLLLVAESPPAGAGFFYFEDLDATDPLFEAVCGVLFEAEPRNDRVPYLKELRRRGIFLTHLKPDAPRAGEPLGSYVGPLLLNVETLASQTIVIIGSDVYDAAFAAMKRARLPVVDVRIPFSASDDPRSFRQKFRQALVRGGLENIIRPLKPGTGPPS